MKISLEHRFKPHLLQIVTIQRRFKEFLQSRQLRAEYLRLRESTIWIQQKVRAKWAARKTRLKFLAMKTVAVIIQKRFRLRRNLNVMRQKVAETVERRDRAAITIQRHWRGVMTRWRARAEHEFELMDWVASIELHSAIPGVRPTIATKAEQVIKRLEASAGAGDIRLSLKNSGNAAKLLSELQALNDFCYCSLEIRARIIREHSDWLLVHLAKVLPSLNRSEQHKSIAHNVLAVVNCLASDIRMKSIQVVSVKADTWCVVAKSLIQLMHDYINYPLLLHQAISILHRLAERKKQPPPDNGTEQLLTEDRLWQRLVERIKDKYRIEQTKDDQHQSECHSGDPASKCSCHSVKSEFRRLIGLMERVGAQAAHWPLGGMTGHGETKAT